MRLLATSDWHWDFSTAGYQRMPEVERYADHLVEVCGREQVDVLLHGGDHMDPGNLFESLFQQALMRKAGALTRATRLGSVWLAGNHDVIDTPVPLSTLSPLAAVEQCWADHSEQSLSVVEEPTVIRFPGLAILCLPYVSRAVEASGRYARELGAALRQAAEARRELPLVVLSHLSVPGMHPGSEEEMPRGRDMRFPFEEVRKLSPAAVLQGHYHARQVVRVEGLELQVIGAPLRFTFGERDDGDRGYLLVDL